MFLVLFAFPALSQSLELSTNEISFAVDGGISYDENFITNVGTESIHIAHKLQVRCHDAADTSALQVCFGILCHGPFNENIVIDENVTWVTLEPGESSGDIAYHMFYSEDQGSDWRVTYYDFFNPADEVYIDIYAGTCEAQDVIVGVEEAPRKQLALDVFRNSGQIRIQWGGAQNATLALMDLSGRVIRNWNAANLQGSVSLHESELSSGMYVVQITSPNGQRVTRRVVVN